MKNETLLIRRCELCHVIYGYKENKIYGDSWTCKNHWHDGMKPEEECGMIYEGCLATGNFTDGLCQKCFESKVEEIPNGHTLVRNL